MQKVQNNTKQGYLEATDVIRHSYTTTRMNGENHYRVQRLQKKEANASAGIANNNSNTPTLETSASYVDISTTNNSKSQIRGVLPTNSNMQKN